MIRTLIALLLWAALLASAPLRAEPDLLPLEQAFRLSAQVVDRNTVEVRFDIADGYYLYRDKFAFSAREAALGEPGIPPGTMKKDEIFGDVEVHRGTLNIHLPLTAGGSSAVALTVNSQGCADAGVCYPPTEQTLMLDPAQPGVRVWAAGVHDADSGGSLLDRLRGRDSQTVNAASEARESPSSPGGAASAPSPAQDDGSVAAGLLRGGNLWLIAAGFFGFGLLLSFTPCVLPMVPILSGIIVGHGAHISRGRAFALSAAYVLGMAVTYALAGVAAGKSGTLLSAALQNAWVLGGFATVFVLLALSMFGFYELQLPPPCSPACPMRPITAAAPSAASSPWAPCPHSSSAPASLPRWPVRCSTSRRPETPRSADWRCSPWRWAWGLHSSPWASHRVRCCRIPGPGWKA